MRMKSLPAAIFASLLASACVSSPKVHKQEARLTANSQMATLDLRGLERITVFRRGERLDDKKTLPAGKLELQVELGAVRSTLTECGEKQQEQRHEAIMATTRGVGRAALFAPIVECGLIAPLSKASEKPRSCFTVSMNADTGKIYRLRLEDSRPFVVEESSAIAVSKTRLVPCSAIEDARKAHTKKLNGKASEGDPESQFQLYLKAPHGSFEELTWLCRAANNRHPEAMSTLARLYARGIRNVREDYVKALVWDQLLKQVADGDLVQKNAALMAAIRKEMTAGQIAKARRLAARWRPNPKRCIADYLKRT